MYSFQLQQSTCRKENYDLCLDSRTLSNIWKQRWLSLAGKIQVFKSLVVSKPAYVATMISVPQKFCDTEIFAQGIYREWQEANIKHSSLIWE